MNANKPCVTAREGIYFFHEAGAVAGHLPERRYVSSVARLSCSLGPRCVCSLEPQIYCAALLNFIYALLFVVHTEHLLLHIPKVEMVEMARPNLHPGSSHFADIVLCTQSIVCD